MTKDSDSAACINRFYLYILLLSFLYQSKVKFHTKARHISSRDIVICPLGPCHKILAPIVRFMYIIETCISDR